MVLTQLFLCSTTILKSILGVKRPATYMLTIVRAKITTVESSDWQEQENYTVLDACRPYSLHS